MKTALRSLLAAAMIASLSLTLAAAQKEGKQAGNKGKKPAALPAGMYKLPETIVLADEQKTKLTAIQKEFTPKFRELAKKGRNLLTTEQQQARKAAVEKANADGTKGKKRQQLIEEALQLTDAQKEEQAKIKAATTKLRGEMETKVVSLLTDEQKAQLPKKGKQAKRKKQAA